MATVSKHLSANINGLLNHASSFKTTKARDRFARNLNCRDFADLCMEL